MKIDVYGENEDANQREHLATFIVSGIDDVATNSIAKKEGSSKPKVSLSFELTRSGLIQLNKAEAKIDETYTVEEKPKKKEDTKTEKNETASEDEEAKEETTETENKTEEQPQEELPIKKTKKRPHTFPLPSISREYKGIPNLTKDQLRAAKDRMRAYDKRDEDKIKTDKAKNDFESVIYSMRDWLNDDENNPYIPQGETETLLNRLSKEEDWLLEGEGDTASYKEYENRFGELNKIMNTFKSRKQEHNMREEAVKYAIAKLDSIYEKSEELKKKKPWITDEQKKDIWDKIDETRAWIEEQVEKQSKQPLYEDPVFRAADLEKQIKKVELIYNRVSAIARPRPKMENIKIDNITIDGKDGGNWEDFIKIENS